MNIQIKITNESNAKELNININSILEIDLEDYVFCCVAGEIGNAIYDACCAQAIASRTLIYYNYINNKIISDDSTRWQAFRAKALKEKNNYLNIINAIKETSNKILLYNNKCIKESVFSANNGGYTVSAKERWGTSIPYLISRKDSYDNNKRRGHGVGLSQEGAKNRAKDGQSYKDILLFYYPNTTIGDISMANIKVNDLINQFQIMYDEHWSYEWGAAKKGCVDCSGAFVYAYKQLNGPSIAHGSNSILRKYCDNTISVNKINNLNIIGYAAFKVRDWASSEQSNSWYNIEPGDAYHIGLVDKTGKYVLNAKSKSKGFSLDPISSWQYFAPLSAVDYSEVNETVIEQPYYAIVTTEKDPLKMRKEPNASSAVITKIPKGELVLINQETNGWAAVEYNGYSGYASLAYLSKTSSNPVESDKNKITITISVDAAKELLDALSAEMTD